MKNRIINGAMVIDQRNAGASVTPVTGAYLVDRWNYQASQASKFTVQQNAGSVTPPVGFSNYMGFTVASSVSIGSGDYFYFRQPVEGFNFADCGWGTANAKTVTLSFQVYSSLTGTFGGSLTNSASNRSYPFSYTVSVANTWTTAYVTVAGDTTGTWVGSTNGVGVYANFSLGMGSTFSGTAGAWAGTLYASATGAVSVVGTNGATFYITGVQLEVGSSATGYEYRQYGTELALCQRYCQVIKATDASDNYARIGSGPATSSTVTYATRFPPVAMRSSPSFTATGNFAVYDGVTVYAITSITALTANSYQTFGIQANGASGLTTPRFYDIITNNDATAKLVISAEL